MNEEAKKKLLRMIPHALYVLTSRSGDKIAAATVSWVTQASFQPPLLAVGLKKDSFTYLVVREAGGFALNFLGEEQKEKAQSFFKHLEPMGDTLGGESFTPSPSLGFPVFNSMAGFAECKVLETVDQGDHLVVVAEVLEASLGDARGILLLSSTGWNYGG